MTPQEMIYVIQAHTDGMKIECREVSGCNDGWHPVDTPLWDFCHFDYRVRPTPPVLRPHWPAICRVGNSGAILTDALYADAINAACDINGNGGVLIRLATEYPPVML